MTPLEPNTPLLQGISQFEVDFVIPRLGVDLPIGIDPFLLYKSREPAFQEFHSLLLSAFNHGIELVRKEQLQDASVLFSFPEASEIGLGYAKNGKQGAGVGSFLSELIIETLKDSPALLERGVRHIEEMQLVSLGIGPDRISDIAANLLKHHLIEYTQKQCQIWNLPLTKGVPVRHIFDFSTMSWYDGYFDLPVSTYDSSPIILVPRRIVRVLPWINYDDYFRMEFSTYLRSKRVKERLPAKSTATPRIPKIEKEKVISVTRSEIERLDRYISAKEASAVDAQPSINYIDTKGICPEAESLKLRLSQITPGTAHATSYQKLILEILNFLFNPELIDGELEVKTIDGTERRDVVFTNDSDQSFWTYLRTEHAGIFLMFETKNVAEVDNFHLNQTATYLGDRLGRIGFVVTRNPLKEAQIKKVFSIYNDSNPQRKVILTISDDDMRYMLDMRCRGNDPMRHIQKLYRAFRTRVQ